jgi:hypothetical protein
MPARRLRDLLAEHVQDLGGETNTSLAERSILRRIATISVELELMERKFVLANGATADDLQLYLSASNALRRLLQTVGLQRRSKEINPSTSLNEIAQRIDVAHEVEREILEAQSAEQEPVAAEPEMAEAQSAEPAMANEPAAASYRPVPRWT